MKKKSSTKGKSPKAPKSKAGIKTQFRYLHIDAKGRVRNYEGPFSSKRDAQPTYWDSEDGIKVQRFKLVPC